MEVYNNTETNGRNCYTPCPKTWLVEAILATIFCCLPFGIVGIVFAAQVTSKYNLGLYDQALEASNNARKWTKITVLLGIAQYLIYILIYAIAGASILALASWA